MQVKLVGIHSVKAKLADGSRRIYTYAWRGGPRMETDPSDEYAFMAEFYRLTRERKDAKLTGAVPDLVRAYKASPDYISLKDTTKRGYDTAIDLIEAEFHAMELAGFADVGARRLLLEWRDAEMADTPRKADLVMSVFALMLAFGLDREMVLRNPLEKLKRLSGGSRRDIIWTDTQMAAFLAVAAPKMRLAMELARWTGQRQGDLLRLTWNAYDGTHIKLRQGKTGRIVRFKVYEPLKRLMDGTKREAVTILTPTRKRRGQVTSWTGDGFRASWAGVCERIGLLSDDDPTFHDLRGTFCTLAYRHYNASIKEIAEITGHTERDAEAIIRKHYLAGNAAIERIEAGEQIEGDFVKGDATL
jgi:integrase